MVNTGYFKGIFIWGWGEINGGIYVSPHNFYTIWSFKTVTMNIFTIKMIMLNAWQALFKKSTNLWLLWGNLFFILYEIQKVKKSVFQACNYCTKCRVSLWTQVCRNLGSINCQMLSLLLWRICFYFCYCFPLKWIPKEKYIHLAK